MYHNELPSYIKLVLILAILIATTGIVNELLIAKNNFRSEMDRSIQSIEQTISRDFAMVTKHIRSLTDSQSLIDYISTPSEETKLIVVEEFLILATNNARYDQIRFIDISGKEKIRIDNSALGPVVISDELLQDISTRYFVTDTLQLNAGEMYISPLDLRIENSKIEVPYKPMVRFATPVFNSQGEKAGIVVVNYAAGHLLPQRGTISQLVPNARLMLVNSDGFWLRGLRPQDEWGFMYGERNNRKFQNDYPQAWSTIKTQQQGFILSVEGVFSYTTIYPIQEAQSETLDSFSYFSKNLTINDFYWIAVAHIPRNTLISGLYTMIFKKYILGLGVITIVCITVLAIQQVIYVYQRKARFMRKKVQETS